MTPQDLSLELEQLSAKYQQQSDELAAVLMVKADKWEEIRRPLSSDTSAERKWNSTAEGRRETVLRLQLKANEKRMSAIKTRLHVLDTEARNIY